MPLRLISLCKHADIAVDRPILIVGRDPSCDARLVSFRVSRQHCCLALGPGGEVSVRDLGSTNGTWINGQRADSGPLRPGDVLGIAHARYRLEVVGDAVPPPGRENQAPAPGADFGSIPPPDGGDGALPPDADRPDSPIDPEGTIW